MNKITVPSKRSKPDGFPYQLICWQKKEEYLEKFIAPFRKYKEEHKGVIVESPAGYSIFTTGELLEKTLWEG